MTNRIGILDGYRAVAIGMVMLYHYFSRWTPPYHAVNLYPYGAVLRDAFSFGYLGVNFFFIISGFVIGMTLERCRNPGEFFIRRLARLWPAMLACSIITFAGLSIIPCAPFPARVPDLAPGLLFISPAILNRLFHAKLNWLDGAYWSLFVEVCFYAWAGFLFFTFRTRFAAAFLGVLVLSAVPLFFEGPVAAAASIALISRYMPWFCAGMGFYLLHAKKQRQLATSLIVASAALLAVQAFRGARPAELVFAAAFFAAFLAFLHLPRAVRLFGSAPITAIGEASYSLYLLHQFLGVSLIAYLATGHGAWTVIYALLVMATMVAVALAVYRLWELPAKERMLSAFRSRIAVAGGARS